MITSKNNEQFYTNKNVITLGTGNTCNFKLSYSQDILLTICYDFSLKNYVILNTFASPNVLFCGKPLKKLELGSFNKLSLKNSDEFLTIRLLQRISA